MKRVFQVMSIVILLAALAGGAYLAQRNQNTQNRASAAETSMLILPNSTKITAGKDFNVDVWANTGKATDKLSGVEFKVSYDSAKLKFVSSIAQNGYTVLNDVVDDTKGTLTFKMVTLGTEKAGAVDLVKLTFKPIANVSGTLKVSNGDMMISGQSATWSAAKYDSSSYSTTGPTTKLSPTAKVTPDAGVEGPISKCMWCGNSCVKNDSNRDCAAVMPPTNKDCTAVSSGASFSCVITESKNPTCRVDKDCPTGQECYQPQTQATGEINLMVQGKRCRVRTNGKARLGEPCGTSSGKTCDTGLLCLIKKTIGGGGNSNGGSNPNTGTLVEKEQENGVCVKGPVTPTPTMLITQCGVRCTSNAACGTGKVCAPIWWPCKSIPIALGAKLQANASIDANSIKSVSAFCPEIERVLPAGYKNVAQIKMPTFYGICRNVSCVNSASCVCPTVTLSIAPTNPIRIETTVLRLSGLSSPSFRVGDTFSFLIDANSVAVLRDGVAPKISGINASLQFTDAVEIIDVTKVDSSASELSKNIDKSTGVVSFSYIWTAAEANLKSELSLVRVTLKAVKTGGVVTLFSLNSGTQSAVGVSSGKSVSMKLSADVESISIYDVLTVCSNKVKGDADCNGTVDLLDFEIWRSEALDKGGISGTVSSTWQSDFNSDSKSDLLDFESWRATVYP